MSYNFNLKQLNSLNEIENTSSNIWGPLEAPPLALVFITLAHDQNLKASSWIWSAKSLVGANTNTIHYKKNGLQ